MIRSYFISAIRQIRKNHFYFLINAIGLSIGIAASLIAIMFVVDERSFDNFHQKADRIFRLNKIKIEVDGAESLRAESAGMMGPTMLDEFPEIEEVVRYQPSYDETVLFRDKANIYLEEGELVFADNSFFKVFDFNLESGDVNSSLLRPSTILLTPELARSIFGTQDPIGKTVTGFNNVQFEVTGIVSPPPRNSHIQFKAIASWATTVPGVGPLGYTFMNNWIAQAISTYILIKEGASSKALEEKFPQFMQSHMPERADIYKLYLQPLPDIYLGSTDIFGGMMARTGNVQYLYVFSVVACFILLIACFNYVNINTSKSTRRAREVGMRKSLGATRSQLVQQFLGESFLISLASGLIALLLVDLFIPVFNSLTGKTLTADLLLNPVILSGLILLILFVSVVSGFYPAVVLSTFKPSEVLKASSLSKLSGHRPRQVLIVFQFAVSIILIAGAIMVQRQMEYLMTRDLGFEKDQVLVVSLTDDLRAHLEPFVNEIKSHGMVKNISVTRNAMGMGFAGTMVLPEGINEPMEVKMFQVDADFDKTFGLKMSEGRFFDSRLASDSIAMIVNEAFVEKAGWTNPLTRVLRFEGNPKAFSVIGVLKDFNYSSLKSKVEPVVMWIEPDYFAHVAIHFSPGNTSSLVSFLSQAWKKYEHRYPFDYAFLDKTFASQYEAEEKLFNTVLMFSGISILIACLGLYGLVSFTIEQRTKEIGIRKVLGATVTGLTAQINQKFVFLAVAGAIIGLPVAYWLITLWLQEFAYHVTPSVWAFAGALLLTMAITIVSVSVQAIKAARANPVNALRAE